MKVQKRSITAFIIMVLVLITGCAEQNNGAEAIAPNAASKMIDNSILEQGTIPARRSGNGS